MPDDFGTIYEGVVAYAAQRVGRTLVAPDQSSLALGCRRTCQHRVQCTATGNEPRLFIKPDLASVGRVDEPIHIFYVTHWRNADNFQYKLWRTVAEIFEHKLHVRNAVAVNWLSEPLAQNEGLLEALGELADHSFEPSQLSCSKALIEQMTEQIEVWSTALRPVTLEKVADACGSLEKQAAWARKYFEAYSECVTTALAANPRNASRQGVWSISRDGCIQARTRLLPRRSIATSYRSSAQLLALLLGGCGVPYEKAIASLRSGKSPGEVGVPEGVLKTFASVTFRTQGTKPVPVLQQRIDIRGQRLTLSDGVLRLIGRCDPVILARIVERYVSSALSTPTWSAYVVDLAMSDARRDQLRARWPSWSQARVKRLAKDALRGTTERILFDMLLAAYGLTIDGLQAAVAPTFRRTCGIELKKIAPHGDTGRHVYRMLLTGQPDSIRPAPGLTRNATIEAVASITGELLARSAKPNPEAWEFDAALQKALGSKMRTFLSKAPNPLLTYVAEHLPAGWQEGHLQGTVLNDLRGGKTGKTDYDFENTGAGIKVATAQDGNEEHKTKELCGRLRCQRVRLVSEGSTLEACRIAEFRAILVLDGDWSEDNIAALYLGGYETVFEASDVGSQAWTRAVSMETLPQRRR